MAIDFPSSPTVGQVFIFGAITYIWDGTKWTSSATDSPFSLGSAATPSITFIGDGNTGIYSPGADQVSITTGGTERFRVDATGQLEAVSLGTAAAPTYSFTTDPNTGIYSPGADQLAFVEGGTEAARIDSSGRLLIGTSTATTTYWASDEQRLSVERANTYAAVTVLGNINGTSGATLTLGKSRGTTVGSFTLVANNDSVGNISFEGTDGTAYRQAGYIECAIDGTPGTNDMPGRLVFSTTADGSSTPTERMRISQNGVVTIKNGAVAEIGTLVDGATITPDLSTKCNFTITLGGNRTLANPTNITAGQSGSIFIVQDGTGSRVLSWGSYWDFSGGTAPTLTTTANAIDRVDYVVRSATSIQAVFTANYS